MKRGMLRLKDIKIWIRLTVYLVVADTGVIGGPQSKKWSTVFLSVAQSAEEVRKQSRESVRRSAEGANNH